MGLTFWQDFLLLPHMGTSFNTHPSPAGWGLHFRGKGISSWPSAKLMDSKAAEGTKAPKILCLLQGGFGTSHSPQLSSEIP